ncbi:putative Acetyltransferase [Oceanicola granulosus HTCC2516]|uniref:Putative Acetyltransferase n=1 Tax=Oceanicola granulosus (strain ATCC BAA-861 / DSM 15982 / KCTC 12143 / HTCC2516) TaxID=314256 RepID=Q2CHW3_OCEGH|nr:GNAT family N-acetyltransferase [Oceanicola granulosus]EAR52181.1 putative Acetyltransferase [Oceanicola granulosus HTCC2516]
MTTTGSDIEIRELTPQDEADWRELWTAYLDFYGTTVPEDVYATTFARLTGPDMADMEGRLARIDGRAVGLVHTIWHRHCWRTEDVCYLQDLYAAHDARGRGVGRALIEAVYAAADARGTPRVYWLTQEDNHAARKLYDRIAKLSPFVKYDRPT